MYTKKGTGVLVGVRVSRASSLIGFLTLIDLVDSTAPAGLLAGSSQYHLGNSAPWKKTVRSVERADRDSSEVYD